MTGCRRHRSHRMMTGCRRHRFSTDDGVPKASLSSDDGRVPKVMTGCRRHRYVK
ncbi:unnamed protein product [Prunus armeniaca]